MALRKGFLAFLSFGLCVFSGNQFQAVFDTPKQPRTSFHHPIHRVAVIGAGPAGLQAAAKLIEHNLTVRLFERAPHPGGNWLYSEETPVRESYPDEPAGQTAKIPVLLPVTHYYNEGAGGLTLDHRWTEHWRPRPVWYNLFTNSPKAELPDVPYGPDIPWVLSHHTIQRHVRSYASHHCLNTNDHCPATLSAPRVASYSTRVEKVEKDAETHTWVLTLRRLEQWWTETFDAVVIATGPYTSAHVPDIEGIIDWSKAKDGEHYSMYHSQGYRHPERFAGKTVLIVGASVSASEIARDISPFAHRIIASVRPSSERKGMRQRSLSRFPNMTEFVPEIASFKPLKKHTAGIRDGKIHLINGSILQGIDEIILATGFRRRPWTMGRYQSYGLAKVWAGTARLPPQEQIDESERDTDPGSYWRQVWLGEALFRRYTTWLNDASLEYGGRFVEPPPLETVELLKYYSVVHFLNNTMDLGGTSFDAISMLSGQLKGNDPWNALVDEDTDW
ncbi:FAD/NAD-P-binding domain-containing protein [Mycena olivaceomarginata]|nr:FAD/NAD-P-binding domain-containing protein [Mycena olivaceomarginata]